MTHRLLLIVLAALLTGAAPPPTLDLCSGSPGSSLHTFGVALRDALKGEVTVRLVDSRGSAANLADMARPDRRCDAAIAQDDFQILHTLDDPADALAVERVIALYPEHAFLLCNARSRAADITRLDPGADRIYIRHARSGSNATWRLFTRLEPAYAKLRTVEFEDTSAALTRLAANTEPACLFSVSRLGGKSLATADRDHGAVLRLVPIVDRDLHRPLGPHKRQTYAPSTITARRYPHLLDADLETQSVDAAFYLATAWKRAHPDAAAALTTALIALVPTL